MPGHLFLNHRPNCDSPCSAGFAKAQPFQSVPRLRPTGQRGRPRIVGEKGINLALLAVSLPPLAAQRRIVAKVDQLMALCEKLEAKPTQAETSREKLLNVMSAGLSGVSVAP